LWSQALNFFMPAGQVITAYTGLHVRATGLVAIAHRRDAARTPRPVMTISQPSDIQLISEDEAVDALNTCGTVPWYRVNRRPRVAPLQPVTGQTAAALNRLYGVPPPDRVPPATPRSKSGRGKPAKRPNAKRATPASAGKGGPTGNGETWWQALVAGSVRSGATRARSLSSAVAQLLKTSGALVALEMLALLLMVRLLG
jgi:hypothetical protein